MGRPKDWHVLDLDADPTPGDPARVESLIVHLRELADDLDQAARTARGLESVSAVRRKAVMAGRLGWQFQYVPSRLTRLGRSYRDVGDALAVYLSDLRLAQAEADRALEEGRHARAALTVAGRPRTVRARRASKKDALHLPLLPGPVAASPVARSEARSRLNTAKRRAADAGRLRGAAAARAKSAIADAYPGGNRHVRRLGKTGELVLRGAAEIVFSLQ